MTKDYRTQEAEIKAACLAVFGSEGAEDKDHIEGWKWEVSLIPGLYLIIWIQSLENDRWEVNEPDTMCTAAGFDLKDQLEEILSQLRDVWHVNPHPALRLFFGAK